MTMLSAKVETGVTRSSSRSRSSAPRIVSAPQTSGSSAATTLRKTQSASRKSSGNASSSACVRSCWIWSLTCRVASAVPPTAAHGGSRCSTRAAAAAPRAAGTSARAYAATSASSPVRRADGRATTGKRGSGADRRLDLPQPLRRRAAHEHEHLRRRRQAGRALDPPVDGGALARGRDEVVRPPARAAAASRARTRRRRRRRRARRRARAAARGRRGRRGARASGPG